MTELERRLQELGRDVVYPETPRFELELGRRPSRLRPLVLALAVLAAALGAVLALSPGARSAFLEIFHLQGATVEVVETLPPVEVRAPDFGERVGREEAERRVGFELLDLGEPDAIFVLDDRMATLVYGSIEEPRLVLSQLNGRVWSGFAKKVGGRGTTVQTVSVNGEPGLFVTGEEHFVMFLDESSDVRDERTFLAGTVLLWNHGDVLLRLEGELTRDEALELARAAE